MIPVRGFKWSKRSRRIAALVCALSPDEKTFPLYIVGDINNEHGRLDRDKFETEVLHFLEQVALGEETPFDEVELAILGQRVKGMMFPNAHSVEVQLENPSLN